jgi:hypothetical protein
VIGAAILVCGTLPAATGVAPLVAGAPHLSDSGTVTILCGDVIAVRFR